MSWDQFYRVAGTAAGVEPDLIHIPSDFIGACMPESLGGLIGDKSVSVVFDNSKIKRLVPGYCATMPFREGIRKTLAWFDADTSRKQIDEEANARWDKLIDALRNAVPARLFLTILPNRLMFAAGDLFTECDRGIDGVDLDRGIQRPERLQYH